MHSEKRVAIIAAIRDRQAMADGEEQMVDGRSKLTTASVEDIEKLYKALERKLSRMRVMLDDFEVSGKAKVKMQYWNSGVEADKKLDVFVRGIESSE